MPSSSLSIGSPWDSHERPDASGRRAPAPTGPPWRRAPRSAGRSPQSTEVGRWSAVCPTRRRCLAEHGAAGRTGPYRRPAQIAVRRSSSEGGGVGGSTPAGSCSWRRRRRRPTAAACPTADRGAGRSSTSAGMAVRRSDDPDPAGVDFGGGAGARVEGGIPLGTGVDAVRVGAVIVIGTESGGAGNAAGPGTEGGVSTGAVGAPPADGIRICWPA